MLSNNEGIERYSCSMFGEHLETHTSGISGKAILYKHGSSEKCALIDFFPSASKVCRLVVSVHLSACMR